MKSPIFLIALTCFAHCHAFSVLQPLRSSKSFSTSAMSYASSATLPLSDKSFESRMKNIVLGPKPKPPGIQKDPSKPKSIVEVTTAEEYEKVVMGETDRLVVVRYYAPWCRTCRAMSPSYYRFVRELENENVLFVDCPVTSQNSELHSALGVTAIPSAHIYHPLTGELVENCRMSRSHYSRYEATVRTYVTGLCSLEYTGDIISSPFSLEFATV